MAVELQLPKQLSENPSLISLTHNHSGKKILMARLALDKSRHNEKNGWLKS